MSQKKHIAILGSTGSIGMQTLEVLRKHPDLFAVELLTAHEQWQLLVKQALEFRPGAVVIHDLAHYRDLVDALAHEGISVYAGNESIEPLLQSKTLDTVVVAIVGYAALLPTIRAIEAGKKIALASKETLVVAGELIMDLASRYNARIVPIDSEHSAIYQCLQGEFTAPEKLIITASGGPFRGLSFEELLQVTPAQALIHPSWSMGAKISIDSATLMNKGLEVIEAHWLFQMPYEAIEVLVHPQSVIHSMVQFPDGSIKAQLGVQDMRIPIQYALMDGYRLDAGFARYGFGPAESLTFELPDTDIFPCLSLAIEAGKAGGTSPCVLNAANEVAVRAFLDGRIRFISIPAVVEKTLEDLECVSEPTLDTLIQTDREARKIASQLIDKDLK